MANNELQVARLDKVVGGIINQNGQKIPIRGILTVMLISSFSDA
jgi:hypothetical protein